MLQVVTCFKFDVKSGLRVKILPVTGLKMRIKLLIGLLFVVLVVALPACTSPTSSPTASPAPSPVEFTKITAPLSLNREKSGTGIPWGSVVYHWANGITEVYGPDNNRLFITKDSEVAMVPHPSGIGQPGESPATHIYEVPSGAHISKGASDNIMNIYLNGTMILTIIDISEDFTLLP